MPPQVTRTAVGWRQRPRRGKGHSNGQLTSKSWKRRENRRKHKSEGGGLRGGSGELEEEGQGGGGDREAEASDRGGGDLETKGSG